MKREKKSGVSRRDMIKTTTAVAGVSALAGAAIPQVHAGENNTIQVALVGCGGRGTGAAVNALSTTSGPIRLVAMADTFQDRLNSSYANLNRTHSRLMDVPESRRFVGFDAYRRAMDSLRENDVVILATPPAFRWVQFSYAIEKGINVFMEKPITVDGPSTRRMLQLAEASERRNLKVGVGLMCRHCSVRGELYNRIQNGDIGDLVMLRAYRQSGPTGSAFTGAKPANMSELEYQIRRFHAFLWASGGAVSDFLIHNIDECCWMKNAWPVECKATGGRHFRGNFIDQNFDSYSMEYTFADGSKMFVEGRGRGGCHNEFASYAHGTRGSAIISSNSHTPARSKIFRAQRFSNDDVVWSGPRQEPNPYQLEWDHLIQAIRRNERYNEVRRGAEASLVTSMGRLAAHSGQKVTRDQMLAHEHEFAPQVAELTMNSEAPVRLTEDGRYPMPQPGLIGRREYE